MPVVIPGAPARAQDDATGSDSAPMAPGPTLDWGVLGGMWWPRLGGKMHLDGPGAGRIDPETDLSLDDMEGTWFVEAWLGESRHWRLRISAFDFDLDDNGSTFKGPPNAFGSVVLNPGDLYDASFEMSSLALDFRFEDMVGPWPADSDAQLLISPTVGLRWFDVDQTISTASASSTASGEWLSVPFGLELEIDWEPDDGLPLGRAVRIEGGVGVGPAFSADGDTGFSWQVRAGITWEPITNVGVMFGYRLLEVDADDGPFEFDAGLQGLTAGASIRF